MWDAAYFTAFPVVYGYDDRNQISTLTIGSRTSTHFYDENGQPTGIRDVKNNTTKFVTGGFGQSVGQVDASGIERVTSMDAANRPVDERVIKTNTNGTKSLLRWIQREYDAVGRPVREIRKLFVGSLLLPDDGSDPKGAADIVTVQCHSTRAARCTYDDIGRRVTTIDPNGNTSVVESDELGRRVAMTDATGNGIKTTYNATVTPSSVTTDVTRPRSSRAIVTRVRTAFRGSRARSPLRIRRLIECDCDRVSLGPARAKVIWPRTGS